MVNSDGITLEKDSFKDKLIPWYFVLFFLVVFIVNGFFVYFAVSSFTGVTTEGAYTKGVAYNEVVAQKRKQDALGWQDNFSLENDGDHYKISLSFSDKKSGELIPIDKVTGILFRPSNSGHDLNLNFTNSEETYVAEFIPPLKGQWEAHIVAYKGDNLIKHRYDVTIK